MVNKKQILITGIALMIIVLMAVSYVSAYQLLCLTDGDKLPPNMNPPRYKCEHDVCQVCVTNNLYPTDLKLCKEIHTCNQFNGNNSGGGGGIDIVPPVLNVNSPVEGRIYSTRTVLFQLSADESSTFYYTDNSKAGGSWVKLATGVTTYSKTLSLKDGLNDLTIKAVDANGNPTTHNVKFNIDSQKPKITKTFPVKGFASGVFEVLFTSGAPKTLVLNYGNMAGGMKNANVDLNQCTIKSGKYDCNVTVSLAEYNNQVISYMFKLTNSADVMVQSKSVSMKVDNAAPVINNPTSMVKVIGKYANFNLSISEMNFADASYYDHSAVRPKWSKLCTALKNGICAKKVSFTAGIHNIDIKVSDKAGNSNTQSLSFTV